jgi:hypothetical protein
LEGLGGVFVAGIEETFSFLLITFSPLYTAFSFSVFSNIIANRINVIKIAKIFA